MQEEILDLVVDQILSDVQADDYSALYDLLETVGRDQCIDYLSGSRQERLVEAGIITLEEATAL